LVTLSQMSQSYVRGFISAELILFNHLHVCPYASTIVLITIPLSFIVKS
jgi:hypothetical protein